MNNSKKEERVKAEVTEGDFVYRLVSEKEIYQDSEDVKLYAELEYVGDQEEIKIYHAASPFYFPIVEKTRNYNIEYAMNEPLLTTTLEKGKPFREEYRGGGAYGSQDEQDYVEFMKDFMENGFPVGEYTVNGFADFFIEANEHDKKAEEKLEDKEKYKMQAQIEFEVVE
ncbi:hypothetical protein DS031_14890 [Bacillus taeanensis]|uniref:Uncharacterized protein n=1 Tax=Bacillus taeanensis TaxID=273032 RepID=A0A366XUM0_9BACI|nr:hypothetical protein DS031_14890 [Bacillus taeanensis]